MSAGPHNCGHSKLFIMEREFRMLSPCLWCRNEELASRIAELEAELEATAIGFDAAHESCVRHEARIAALEADLQGWLEWYWEHANGRSAKTRELLFKATALENRR